MRRLLLLFLGLTFRLILCGQTDSVPTPATQIDAARAELLQSFAMDDRMNAQFWLDSLQRIDQSQYLSLYWDERWLLYLWLENYSVLFLEVEQFLGKIEQEELNKLPPTKDSLFTLLDNRLFENQAYLFDQTRKAWLSTEERAFGSLLINFLLRLSLEGQAASEFDEALNGFLKNYPKSRFAPFIRARMYNNPQPADWAIGLDILFTNGNWTKGLERSLRPMFGADFALTFWKNRFNNSLRLTVGGQKIARDVDENGYIWAKDDPSTFFALELETGYDIYNKPGIRIYPSLAGGFSTVRPPEDEENPNPDYYGNFKFTGLHWTAALQADIKFNLGKGNVSSSYHGVRIRLGRRWLYLDEGNPEMTGDLFFFSVGYTLFSRQARSLP